MYMYYTEEFSIFVSLREEYLNCVFFLPRNPLVCMSNMTSDGFSIKLMCFWESLTGFMKCTVRETRFDMSMVVTNATHFSTAAEF